MTRHNTMTQDFRERAKLLRSDLKTELGYGPKQVAVRSSRNFMRVHPLVEGLDTEAIKRLGEKYEMWYLDLMRADRAGDRAAVIYSGIGFKEVN